MPNIVEDAPSIDKSINISSYMFLRTITDVIVSLLMSLYYVNVKDETEILISIYRSILVRE